MVRAYAHGAMGRRIDPSCGEPIELSVLDDAYKTLACYSERIGLVAAAGFLSRYLSGP